MTEAELIQVVMELSEAMNSQFEFWLTITFGFVMAIHFTKDKLSIGTRRFLVGLYSTTSFFIVIRFLALISNAGFILQRIQDSGFQGIGSAIPYQGAITLLSLVVIMLVGTIAAIYYSRRDARNDT